MFNANFEGDVTWSFDLIARCYWLANPISWFEPVWFFSLGMPKSKIYTRHPRSIDQLKDASCQEIVAITHEMIRWFMDNFGKRLRQCVDNNGKTFDRSNFKTK